MQTNSNEPQTFLSALLSQVVVLPPPPVQPKPIAVDVEEVDDNLHDLIYELGF